MLDAEINDFYERGDEDRRLTVGGRSRVEFVRTLELLERYLPDSPASVLDVRGGTGIYAATVGVRRPVWAADVNEPVEPDTGPGTINPGTINLVVMLPVRLSDAALVNAVSTATEAKVQALLHHGVDGTGTASDAVAVLCVADGTAHEFGGPRSRWGSRIARAVHDVTAAGIAAQQR